MEFFAIIVNNWKPYELYTMNFSPSECYLFSVNRGKDYSGNFDIEHPILDVLCNTF